MAIAGPLGEGGMGVALRARDTTLLRDVCMTRAPRLHILLFLVMIGGPATAFGQRWNSKSRLTIQRCTQVRGPSK
jgi:hypothetical protein